MLPVFNVGRICRGEYISLKLFFYKYKYLNKVLRVKFKLLTLYKFVLHHANTREQRYVCKEMLPSADETLKKVLKHR